MQVPRKRSSAHTLLYFLYCHALFLLAILCNVVLLIGPFYYPGTVGLFLALPYWTFVFLSRPELTPHGNAAWPWFSQNFFIFRHLRQTLDITFLDFPHPTAAATTAAAATTVPPQYIYACHPHGVASDYRVLMDGMFCQRNVYPKTLAATILFRLPLIREIALVTACLDARKSVAEAILRSGQSILVLPGGEAEQIRTQHGRELIYLKNRKGFIKLALRHGVPVVPMYAFGVSDYYYTSNVWLAPRVWLTKQFQICLPLAVGLWRSPFCPLPQTTTIVFGEPLTFQSSRSSSGDDAGPSKNTNIDDEQLDAAHKAFMDALIKLFDTHKERLGYGDRKLEIV